MSERSYFFGDESYTTEQFAEFISVLFATGVSTGSNNLRGYVVGNDRTVRLLSGTAVVKGRAYINDNTKTFSPTAADATYNRYDRLVLKFNLPTLNITAQYKEGTPSITPAPPTLVDDADEFEISLCKIKIVAESTVIAVDDVTDERSNITSPHIHSVANVTNLQAILDGKFSVVGGTVYGDIDRQGELASAGTSKSSLGILEYYGLAAAELRVTSQSGATSNIFVTTAGLGYVGGKKIITADEVKWSQVFASAIGTSGTLTIPTQIGESEMLIQLINSVDDTVYASYVSPIDTDGRMQLPKCLMTSVNLVDDSVDYRTIYMSSATSIVYSAAKAGAATKLTNIVIWTK